MPIRKSAFWEQKGSGNGQISRANFEEKKGRKNLKNILSLAPHNEHIEQGFIQKIAYEGAITAILTLRGAS